MLNVKNVLCNDDSHFRALEEYLRRMSEAYSNSAARSIPNIGRILGINHFSAQYMEGLWEV